MVNSGPEPGSVLVKAASGTLFNMVFDGPHHHNGIIHHQTDGQHQPEQGERID